MSETIIAKRYADALFQLGEERSNLHQLESELITVREVYASNPKLVHVLQHPRVTLDQKKQLVAESFKPFSKEVQHTLQLLVDRHREEIIPEMIAHFIKRMNDAKGTADAEVYSVRELSDKEKQRISETFAPKVDKRSLNLTNIVDPEIIGGIRLRIGNRIFDGSVSGKLRRMQRELTSANK